MAKTNKNLKLVFMINEPAPDWHGATGVITADLIAQELPDFKENVFYVCGPPPMVTAMTQMVEGMGLTKEKLKLEYFTGYASP